VSVIDKTVIDPKCIYIRTCRVYYNTRPCVRCYIDFRAPSDEHYTIMRIGYLRRVTHTHTTTARRHRRRHCCRRLGDRDVFSHTDNCNRRPDKFGRAPHVHPHPPVTYMGACVRACGGGRIMRVTIIISVVGIMCARVRTLTSRRFRAPRKCPRATLNKKHPSPFFVAPGRGRVPAVLRHFHLSRPRRPRRFTTFTPPSAPQLRTHENCRNSRSFEVRYFVAGGEGRLVSTTFPIPSRSRAFLFSVQLLVT